MSVEHHTVGKNDRQEEAVDDVIHLWDREETPLLTIHLFTSTTKWKGANERNHQADPPPSNQDHQQEEQLQLYQFPSNHDEHGIFSCVWDGGLGFLAWFLRQAIATTMTGKDDGIGNSRRRRRRLPSLVIDLGSGTGVVGLGMAKILTQLIRSLRSSSTDVKPNPDPTRTGKCPSTRKSSDDDEDILSSNSRLMRMVLTDLPGRPCELLQSNLDLFQKHINDDNDHDDKDDTGIIMPVHVSVTPLAWGRTSTKLPWMTDVLKSIRDDVNQARRDHDDHDEQNHRKEDNVWLVGADIVYRRSLMEPLRETLESFFFFFGPEEKQQTLHGDCSNSPALSTRIRKHRGHRRRAIIASQSLRHERWKEFQESLPPTLRCTRIAHCHVPDGCTNLQDITVCDMVSTGWQASTVPNRKADEGGWIDIYEIALD